MDLIHLTHKILIAHHIRRVKRKKTDSVDVIIERINVKIKLKFSIMKYGLT